MMMLVMVLWLLSWVTVSVTPSAVPVNGTIRVTCTVPRHPDNRWLTIAVPGSGVYSTRQLDGEAEKITHVMYVQHIECGTEEVICEVTDNLGKQYRSVRSIAVAGCE